jgi:proteic killer suppression protein
MSLPSLEQDIGDRKGQYSLTVTANWRLVFEFDGEAFTKVDLEDYH